jgi:hypothetical protein
LKTKLKKSESEIIMKNDEMKKIKEVINKLNLINIEKDELNNDLKLDLEILKQSIESKNKELNEIKNYNLFEKNEINFEKL